jgi:glycosyltransferase involved in cell wall biosynthesis
MNFLFVHQNFPGQFRHVAAALADSPRNKVVAIGDGENIRARPRLHPAITVLGYPALRGANPSTHHYLRDYERAVRRGQAVARTALDLKKKGFSPDVVVVHPAWGEGIFLKDVFPAARHVHYFEFFYRGEGSDVGFDPEYPASFDDRLRVRVKNSTQLLSLDVADAGLSPTHWQKGQYPAAFQDRIEVIHDGIDTSAVCPDAAAELSVDDRTFTARDRLITYVARNLEPYRGFHVFMRALPAILSANPDAQVLVVGGDEVSYGRPLKGDGNYRTALQKEIGGRADWSRVHFLGRLPYAQYLAVLRISSAHAYLTYPFVLSWSMLESMSAGCALVASATPPVQEVVRDGENALLVDFFDAEGLAERISDILRHPASYRRMRENARETIRARYDLNSICLPAMQRFLTNTWLAK